MSAAENKAVFLSYASQDAEAAKRICEALRAAGVEVWFDQSELRGGDSWDAKIRKQIKECALFVPIISANTQARSEGYFRLEWKLAVDRSHLMADDSHFLFPVVIDDTPDATARVPDKFRDVQWTRLNVKDTPESLAARVGKLLSGDTGRRGTAGSGDPALQSRGGARQRGKSNSWMRVVVPIAGMLFGLIFAFRSAWSPAKHPEAKPAVTTPSAPVSEARKLATQGMQLLEDPNFTRETSWLADELCQRALALDAGDAEIWAVASLASSNLYSNTYDTSAGRREKARSQAARASQLDPQSVRAALAVARSMDDGTGNDAELLRMLRELHRRAPGDQHVIFSLIRAEGEEGNESAVQDLFRELRALPRTGMLPLSLWFAELRLRFLGRFAEAEAILDEMLAGPVVLRGAYYEKLNLLMLSWHDAVEVEPFIERIPVAYQQEPAFGSAIAFYWLWLAQPEKSLQVLAQVPQEYFEEYSAREPKAYLTGWAHTLAGRPAAAQAEWRNALSLVEERLKSDSRNFTLLNQRALLLALTGQREAAREAWQLRVELGGERNQPAANTEAQVFLALNESERAIAAIERAWPKLPPGLRAQLLPVMRYHPAYAAIRDDPRLQRILAEGAAMLQNLKAQQTGAPKSRRAASLPVDQKSVAVLAFANLSDDKANEYFSDGISEELLNVLAKIPGLTVRGRSSGFYFKGKQVKSSEIGQQLNVSYLVQGSVRRSGDRVRISAQLIRAATDDVVWSSGSLDRDLKDIFAVQDEIAGLIAKNLSLKMGVAARAPHQVNPEALTALLEGRSFWVLRTMEGFARAGELFNRAVALDPDWAPAHAALASLLAIEASYLKGGGESMSERFALAAREAKRAIELDPTLGEPHAALGKIAMEDRRFAEAEEESSRAMELEPNNALVVDWHGDLMVTRGRLDLAIVAYRRAMELEPLSPYILWDLAWELMHVRRFGEALPLIERAATLTPTGSARLSLRRARLLLELGRKAEAEVALRVYLESPRTGSDPQIANEAVWCLQTLGSLTDRERWTAELLRQYPDIFASGVILLMLGRELEAYPLLEKIPTIFWQQLYWDPVFDPVRDTPRFQQLLVKLGCAAEYKVARETLARMLKEQEKKK